MARNKLVMNYGKWREIVGNSPEIYGVCDRSGAELAARLGSRYEHDTIYGRQRVHTRVKTSGIAGFLSERKSGALMHAKPRIV